MSAFGRVSPDGADVRCWPFASFRSGITIESLSGKSGHNGLRTPQLPTAASDIVLGWVCNGAVESSGAEFAPLGRYLREDAVTEQRVQRRLAAILAADVVGYSALMQRAEEANYAEFERLKRELIQPQAARAPLRRGHSNCRHQFL